MRYGLSDVCMQRIERLGDVGAAWLKALPTVVDELAEQWKIAVGEPLTGGSAGFVARVRTPDGDAVLKVMIPGEGGDAQIRTLQAARGRGYVRLLAADVRHEAMLQEALGPSLDALSPPPEEAIRLLCAALLEAWTVAPVPATDGPGKAEQLAALVREVGGRRQVPDGIVRRALRCAERRAADPATAVLVHGDPHTANLLKVPSPREGAPSGFVFVDPDGFLAEPAYDAGVVLRDWCPELLAAPDPGRLARRYCALLAAGTGLDETAVWEWGYLERVTTGLHLLDLGAADLAGPFLRTASLLTDA